MCRSCDHFLGLLFTVPCEIPWGAKPSLCAAGLLESAPHREYLCLRGALDYLSFEVPQEQQLLFHSCHRAVMEEQRAEIPLEYCLSHSTLNFPYIMLLKRQ